MSDKAPEQIVKVRRVSPSEARETFERLSTIDSDECQIWPYSLCEGYGNIRISLKKIGVHRLSLMNHEEPPDDGKYFAAHKCGNRACLNPKHLYWATQLENSQDKYLHDTVPFGNKSCHAKLSEQEVWEVFHATGRPQTAIAKTYGVTQSTVSRIKNKMNWWHMTDKPRLEKAKQDILENHGR